MSAFRRHAVSVQVIINIPELFLFIYLSKYNLSDISIMYGQKFHKLNKIYNA